MKKDRAEEAYAAMKTIGRPVTMPELADHTKIPIGSIGAALRRFVKHGVAAEVGVKKMTNGHLAKTFKLNGTLLLSGRSGRQLSITLDDVRQNRHLNRSQLRVKFNARNWRTVDLAVCLVSLLENPYLSNEQRSVVAESEQRFKIGQVERARKLIDPIRRKAWGNSKQYGSPEHLANRRRVDLEKPIDVICVVADRLSTIEVPLLGEADRVAFAHRINDACKQLIQLRRRINRGG